MVELVSGAIYMLRKSLSMTLMSENMISAIEHNLSPTVLINRVLSRCSGCVYVNP